MKAFSIIICAIGFLKQWSIKCLSCSLQEHLQQIGSCKNCHLYIEVKRLLFLTTYQYVHDIQVYADFNCLLENKDWTLN